MSILEKFRAYSWFVYIVCALTVTCIAWFFLLPCNCCWEIYKPKTLNFLFRICPYFRRVANTKTVDKKRSADRKGKHLDDRLTDLENGLLEVKTNFENGQGNNSEDLKVLLKTVDVLNVKVDKSEDEIKKLNELLAVALGSEGFKDIRVRRQSTEMSTLPLSEGSSSSGAQPSSSTASTSVTFSLPTRTALATVTEVTDFLGRHARGVWRRWRGSIVIQASLSIDSCVLSEIGELVKKCCSVENGFTLQIASWGVFYHKDDSVNLLMLEEDYVPVNIETMWNKKGTGITMSGLNLNGAVIKAATERTNTTLRSSGPPCKGRGNFDELHFPTEGFEGIEESLIHAARIVEFDGMSLVVRSEARYVVPHKSFLKESVHDESQMIPALAKMLQSVLGSILDLKTKQQCVVEHWKGVLQMEMLECRKKVTSAFTLSMWERSIFHPPRDIPMCLSSRDREYWQRALHDLSEDHLSTGSCSVSSTIHSTRGRIKFLLGEFESALLDLDRAVNSTTEGLTSTLLDRAMVKCALARYSEAMEDIKKAAEINPNSRHIKIFRACFEDIFFIDSSKSSTPILQPTQPVLDLLTGDCYPHFDSPRYYRNWHLIMKSTIMIPDWTEVRDLSKDLPELHLEQETSHNHVSQQLLLDYLNLYGMTGYDSLRTGKKLAEGGQAEIFEAIGTRPECTQTNLVHKVFKQAFPLQTWLQPDVLQLGGVYLDHPSPVLCTALGVKFLNDGRCAFVFPRHWGDLRRLIHEQIVIPFEFSTSVKIMLQIAEGMRSLHIHNIMHKDLKASNILVNGDNPAREDFRCMVADFECSVGVMGTGFWRAPEILTQIKHRTSEPKVPAWSKAADVYSFAMVCYEILTGRTPFGDLRISDYDAVLSGRRPQLPPFLGSELRTLIERCWHADPEQRPRFSEICKVLADLKGNAAGPFEHFETHDCYEDLGFSH